LADAIARGIESVDPKLILFAPDNTELARAGETRGVQIAREIFADRNYLNNGWLVPRTRPDALLRDPKEAAERVLRMLREGKVRGIVSIERRTRLVTASVGFCWFANYYGRALLLRTRDHDAARWGCLCFFARSVRKFYRVLVWLDPVSCHSNRNHRCGSDCVCKISRRFRSTSFAGQLSGCANLVRWVRD